MKPPPNWLVIGAFFFAGIAFSFSGLVSLAEGLNAEMNAATTVLGFIMLTYAITLFVRRMPPPN